MPKLTNLNNIGNLCIRAAWAISVIWIIQAFVELSSIWNTYHNRVDSVYQTGYDFWGTLVAPQFFSFLQSVSGTIFYFCILFAIGSVLKSWHQSAHPVADVRTLNGDMRVEDEIDDEVTYESLD